VTFRNLISMLAVLLATSFSLSAQGVCTMAVASGTYLYSGDGWVTGTAGTLAPISVLGVATIDADGTVSGLFTQSLAGNVTTGTIAGTATMASNCVGAVKYSVNNETETYEMKLVLIPNTGEIHSMFTKNPAAPTTMICKFTRIAVPNPAPAEETSAVRKQ